MAPEVRSKAPIDPAESLLDQVLMKRTEYFPKPVDYWALGILLYTLLTGRKFYSLNHMRD
jgi:serine/threonine protein kinase